MNTHTPGPWIATGFKNTIVNDSNGNTLALRPSHDGSVGNAIANARLIAAAPDLLEACELLLGRLDEDEDQNASGSEIPPALPSRKQQGCNNEQATSLRAGTRLPLSNTMPTPLLLTHALRTLRLRTRPRRDAALD